MIIEIQKNLRKERTDCVQTVVIRDSFEHPILLVREIVEGTVMVDRAGEEGFERALKIAGVDSHGAKYVEARR